MRVQILPGVPTLNYRRIYEANHGSIPKGYDIHHVDGNHANNHPANLQAVTKKEHYDIHWAKGDYAACQVIAVRMNKTHEEISKLTRLANKERVKNGTHNWLGGKQQRELTAKRFANGTHHWLANNHGEKTRQRNLEKSAKGIHPFQDREKQRQIALDRVVKKNHPWQEENLSTIVCPRCGYIGKTSIMYRWHFDKCKPRKRRNKK